MASGDPYRYQILEEIKKALREEIVLDVVGKDSCGPILSNSIVFKKVARRNRDFNEGHTFDRVFPGILISCPQSETVDVTRGTNGQDEYVYKFLLQIIDSDNFEPTANIRTYWKWQEQVNRLFQLRCFKYVDASKCLSKAVVTDTLDDRLWLKEENFVAGVLVDVQVWMTRGPT